MFSKTLTLLQSWNEDERFFGFSFTDAHRCKRHTFLVVWQKKNMLSFFQQKRWRSAAEERAQAPGRPPGHETWPWPRSSVHINWHPGGNPLTPASEIPWEPWALRIRPQWPSSVQCRGRPLHCESDPTSWADQDGVRDPDWRRIEYEQFPLISQKQKPKHNNRLLVKNE